MHQHLKDWAMGQVQAHPEKQSEIAEYLRNLCLNLAGASKVTDITDQNILKQMMENLFEYENTLTS